MREAARVAASGTGEPMDITFSIYLGSKTRWAHLTKTISLPVMPRVGESVKFKNDMVGDYFAWKITDISYRETGQIVAMTELLNNIDGRGYSFEEEEEFDEYFSSYVAEGWSCENGVRANTHVLDGSLEGHHKKPEREPGNGE